MNEKRIFFIAIVLLSYFAKCHFYSTAKSLRTQCPRLYEQTFKGYIPRGNLSAGKLKMYTLLQESINNTIKSTWYLVMDLFSESLIVFSV